MGIAAVVTGGAGMSVERSVLKRAFRAYRRVGGGLRGQSGRANKPVYPYYMPVDEAQGPKPGYLRAPASLKLLYCQVDCSPYQLLCVIARPSKVSRPQAHPPRFLGHTTGVGAGQEHCAAYWVYESQP